MPSLGPLVVMRFLAGAGAAAVIPVAIAWIGDVVPYERRQPVLARYHLGPDPGHRLRPGGRRPAGRPDRLARDPGGAGHRAYRGRRAAAAARCAGSASACRRRARSAGRESAAPAMRRAAAAAGCASCSAPRSSRASRCSARFAYVGAELHERFGLGLGMIGAMLASFGVGALVYSWTAGMLVPRLGQPGLWPSGAVAARRGLRACSRPCPRRGSRRPPSPSSASASTCCTTRCRPTPRRWRPSRAGSPCRCSRSCCSCGQSVGVALAAPVMDRYGARPIFLVSVVVILATWRLVPPPVAAARHALSWGACPTPCVQRPRFGLEPGHELASRRPRRAPQLSSRQPARGADRGRPRPDCPEGPGGLHLRRGRRARPASAPPRPTAISATATP